MKHRADVLQIERPGGSATGGRHAVPKAKSTKTAKDRGPVLRKADPEMEPTRTDPPADPQLDVVAGKEGTLSGDVVELTSPPMAPSTLLETVAPAHHHPEAAANPTDLERAASPLTSTGKWRTRSLMRSLTFVLLVVAAAVTGLAGRYYFESTTDSRMRLLVTSCLVVAGLWALLTATAPQVVTLKGSVLTVKSRRSLDRFDLAEGMQQLELIGDPLTSKWALVLHRGDNTVVRLGRRDVDARTLDPLVRKFREIAERRRSEHWARMGL